MKLLSLRVWSEVDEAERARIMARSTQLAGPLDPGPTASISGLFADVKERGDAAVIDATKRFDKVDIESVLVPAGEGRAGPCRAGSGAAGRDPGRHPPGARLQRGPGRGDARVARRRIGQGILVGEEHSPIPSVGLFVPCGKGSFPSVMVMDGVPAIVAGVPEYYLRSCRRCRAPARCGRAGGRARAGPDSHRACERAVGNRGRGAWHGERAAGGEGGGPRLPGRDRRAGHRADPRRRHEHALWAVRVE